MINYMRSIETGPPPEAQEQTLPVSRYWEKYNFPGEAPPPGSPAEKRVVEICEAYVGTLIGKSSRKNTASSTLQKASNSERRRLHNQLGIMVFGQERTNLSPALARDLADFAASVTHDGLTMSRLESMLR